MALETRYRYCKYQLIEVKLANTLARFQNYIQKFAIKKFDLFIILYLGNMTIYIKRKKHVYFTCFFLH